MGYIDKLRDSSNAIRTETDVDKKATTQPAIVQKESIEPLVTSGLITNYWREFPDGQTPTHIDSSVFYSKKIGRILDSSYFIRDITGLPLNTELAKNVLSCINKEVDIPIAIQWEVFKLPLLKYVSNYDSEKIKSLVSAFKDDVDVEEFMYKTNNYHFSLNMHTSKAEGTVISKTIEKVVFTKGAQRYSDALINYSNYLTDFLNHLDLAEAQEYLNKTKHLSPLNEHITRHLHEDIRFIEKSLVVYGHDQEINQFLKDLLEQSVMFHNYVYVLYKYGLITEKQVYYFLDMTTSLFYTESKTANFIKKKESKLAITELEKQPIQIQDLDKWSEEELLENNAYQSFGFIEGMITQDYHLLDPPIIHYSKTLFESLFRVGFGLATMRTRFILCEMEDIYSTLIPEATYPSDVVHVESLSGDGRNATTVGFTASFKEKIKTGIHRELNKLIPPDKVMDLLDILGLKESIIFDRGFLRDFYIILKGMLSTDPHENIYHETVEEIIDNIHSFNKTLSLLTRIFVANSNTSNYSRTFNDGIYGSGGKLWYGMDKVSYWQLIQSYRVKLTNSSFLSEPKSASRRSYNDQNYIKTLHDDFGNSSLLPVNQILSAHFHESKELITRDSSGVPTDPMNYNYFRKIIAEFYYRSRCNFSLLKVVDCFSDFSCAGQPMLPVYFKESNMLISHSGSPAIMNDVFLAGINRFGNLYKDFNTTFPGFQDKPSSNVQTCISNVIVGGYEPDLMTPIQEKGKVYNNGKLPSFVELNGNIFISPLGLSVYSLMLWKPPSSKEPVYQEAILKSLDSAFKSYYKAHPSPSSKSKDKLAWLGNMFCMFPNIAVTRTIMNLLFPKYPNKLRGALTLLFHKANNPLGNVSGAINCGTDMYSIFGPSRASTILSAKSDKPFAYYDTSTKRESLLIGAGNIPLAGMRFDDLFFAYSSAQVGFETLSKDKLTDKNNIFDILFLKTLDSTVKGKATKYDIISLLEGSYTYNSSNQDLAKRININYELGGMARTIGRDKILDIVDKSMSNFSFLHKLAKLGHILLPVYSKVFLQELPETEIDFIRTDTYLHDEPGRAIIRFWGNEEFSGSKGGARKANPYEPVTLLTYLTIRFFMHFKKNTPTLTQIVKALKWDNDSNTYSLPISYNSEIETNLLLNSETTSNYKDQFIVESCQYGYGANLTLKECREKYSWENTYYLEAKKGKLPADDVIPQMWDGIHEHTFNFKNRLNYKNGKGFAYLRELANSFNLGGDGVPLTPSRVNSSLPLLLANNSSRRFYTPAKYATYVSDMITYDLDNYSHIWNDKKCFPLINPDMIFSVLGSYTSIHRTCGKTTERPSRDVKPSLEHNYMYSEVSYMVGGDAGSFGGNDINNGTYEYNKASIISSGAEALLYKTLTNKSLIQLPQNICSFVEPKAIFDSTWMFPSGILQSSPNVFCIDFENATTPKSQKRGGNTITDTSHEGEIVADGIGPDTDDRYFSGDYEVNGNFFTSYMQGYRYWGIKLIDSKRYENLMTKSGAHKYLTSVLKNNKNSVALWRGMTFDKLVLNLMPNFSNIFSEMIIFDMAEGGI